MNDRQPLRGLIRAAASRVTWLEYLAGSICVLLALNLLLPGTIGLWEGRLLSALGIGSDAKLMIGVLAVMLVLYWRLRRNKWSVATATREVPGWLAAIDMLVIVLGAGAVVWMASS